MNSHFLKQRLINDLNYATCDLLFGNRRFFIYLSQYMYYMKILDKLNAKTQHVTFSSASAQ